MVVIPFSSGQVFGHSTSRLIPKNSHATVVIPFSSGQVFGPAKEAKTKLQTDEVVIPFSSGQVFGPKSSAGTLSALAVTCRNPLFIGSSFRTSGVHGLFAAWIFRRNPLFIGSSFRTLAPRTSTWPARSWCVVIPFSSGQVFGPNEMNHDYDWNSWRRRNPLFIGSSFRT